MLERTMCPGACPDYSLFVYGDGKVVYEGRHYVAVKGKREGHIPKVRVKQLLEEFYRIDYFSLKDRFAPIANDGAITKTSIRAEDRVKEVINCHPSRAAEDLYQLKS